MNYAELCIIKRDGKREDFSISKIKQYLTVMSRTILLWNMTTDNVPALLDFWELGLSSAKDLKLLYDNHFAKLSIPMQACIMQLLNDSTCRDTDSEYSL